MEEKRKMSGLFIALALVEEAGLAPCAALDAGVGHGEEECRREETDDCAEDGAEDDP